MGESNLINETHDMIGEEPLLIDCLCLQILDLDSWSLTTWILLLPRQ